jgi:S-adenosylmethionine/arginine decarboxylase-like enzyme
LDVRKVMDVSDPNIQDRPLSSTIIASSVFEHVLVELTAVPAERLVDVAGLASLVVAAAGAIGMPPYAPPLVREGTGTVAVGLLCREGHIILHASPGEGLCLVDIVARSPALVGRGLDVIQRRLMLPAR